MDLRIFSRRNKTVLRLHAFSHALRATLTEESYYNSSSALLFKVFGAGSTWGREACFEKVSSRTKESKVKQTAAIFRKIKLRNFRHRSFCKGKTRTEQWWATSRSYWVSWISIHRSAILCMYLLIGKGQSAQKGPYWGEDRIKRKNYE